MSSTSSAAAAAAALCFCAGTNSSPRNEVENRLSFYVVLISHLILLVAWWR
jgi:hypothetical protein